jgi:hypothetical protein
VLTFVLLMIIFVSAVIIIIIIIMQRDDARTAAPISAVDSVEAIACQCYNWGLQGLSLGSINSGNESERLIGKAEQLLPYCPNLAHHEEDFTQVYKKGITENIF